MLKKRGLRFVYFSTKVAISLYLANCGVVRYFFLAVVDVQANYLTGRAFQYTSLIGVQVSSESKIFLQAEFLARKSRAEKKGGVSVCGDWPTIGVGNRRERGEEEKCI